MPLDLNGYQLTSSSGLVFGGSNAKVSTGGVLQSNSTPMMFGARTGGATTYNVYPWPVNSTTINTGAWTSNTTWTCPVAGIYCINISLICGNGGQAGYVGVIVNGGLTYFGYYGCPDQWDTFTFQVLYKLAVSDTVAWAVNAAPAPASGQNGAYGDNHHMACIWFVG
jgi:hypothetical protein